MVLEPQLKFYVLEQLLALLIPFVRISSVLQDSTMIMPALRLVSPALLAKISVKTPRWQRVPPACTATALF
jgi:hypothetical protein